MVKKFFCVLGLIGFMTFGQTNLSAQIAYPQTPDQINQVSKTCEEFCAFKAGEASNKQCLESCTGCLSEHSQNYPDLGHSVCSGSYGSWLDMANTSRETLLTNYQDCKEASRQIEVNKVDGSGIELLPNQLPVSVSDMYRLSKKTDGTWGVESLNPYCYKNGDGQLLDYSSRGEQMIWWERIDGPLAFQSVIQPKMHQPLIAKCTEAMTTGWLSKIDNYGSFVGNEKNPGCSVATTTETKDYRLVSICPPLNDDSQRNYRQNEQIYCSKKMFEIKLNCECQQLGLNAWLKVYESQGSYLTNLQNYYDSLGNMLYFLRDGTSTPTKIQTFGKNAPEAAKVQKKVEHVKLGYFLTLSDYTTEYAANIIDLKGTVHRKGQYTNNGTNDIATEEEVSIATLLAGTGKGLSWKTAPSKSTVEAVFQEDYTRVYGLIMKIAKMNQVEKDPGFRQFMTDIDVVMNLVALRPQGSLKNYAVRIDGQLGRWKSLVHDAKADGTDKPKNPLKPPVGSTLPAAQFFIGISKDEADKNIFVSPPAFSEFKTEYIKLEDKKVLLLRPNDANGDPSPEYKKFQILKQRRLDLQKKVWLLDKRSGSFKQAQHINSTTSYPVTKVLRTKYETRRTNGSGGTTISPGSTESEMVLLKHERNEEFCRDEFIKINKEKKKKIPDWKGDTDGKEFQKRRENIRDMEVKYKKHCKNNFIDKVIYTVSQVLGTAGILLIIVGCYFLVTAQGDDGQITKGKNYLTYAAIGLAISFMSYTIVQFILDAILW